jgi:hypothetical protein
VKISLLHATRRPAAARKCQELWLSRADNRASIEVVTAVDADDVASRAEFPGAVVVWSPQGPVRAWNVAAADSTGDILVTLDDDWEPPHGWDEIIISRMAGADVLKVGDKHRKDGLICHPIISRTFYQELGYLFHPKFYSVYCDDFFTDQAVARGFVDASDVEFLHANPSQGYGAEDEVSRNSNSSERYRQGSLARQQLHKQMALAFTVCGRSELLERSLKSWLNTELPLVSAVHFFIEPHEDKRATVAVIQAFEMLCPVPVILHHNRERLGVLRNPWHLFENMFKVQLAPFVILAEDDFLVSPDILNFFEATRRQEALAVCAKNVGASSDTDPSKFVLEDTFTGNIWGTSRRMWDAHLRDTWDFDYTSGNADETSSGWDWNISLRVRPKSGLKCLLPTASRSYHIGITGVHCTGEEYPATTTPNFVREAYQGGYRHDL